MREIEIVRGGGALERKEERAHPRARTLFRFTCFSPVQFFFFREGAEGRETCTVLRSHGSSRLRENDSVRQPPRWGVCYHAFSMEAETLATAGSW